MSPVHKLADLASLHATQWLPRAAIERLQMRRLRRVLEVAATAPFYRDAFARAAFDWRSVRTLEGLSRAPIATREALVAAYPEGVLTRAQGPRDVVFSTSGSSGQRMEIAYAARANDTLDAVYARALFATGYRPWHRIAYFWWEEAPRAPRLYERLGLMKKHLLPLDPDPRRQLAMLRTIEPAWVYNFPSVMMPLARLVEREGLGSLALSGIICHGELLPPPLAETLSRVFECPVFDQYGAQEFNRIGWTCGASNAMHLDAESVHLEVVDGDGQPCPPGVDGELVLTGLVNDLMPMVRYRIGDVGRRVAGRCACGRGLPLFELTEGRADDVLELADGRRVGPRVLAPRIERLEGFHQYRLIQRAPTRFELRYVPDSPPPSLEPALRSVLEELLGDVEIEVGALERIELNRRGKLKKIVRAFG